MYDTTVQFDYPELDRLLDRVKARVFMGKNAAFLSTIMCSMNFSWDTSIKTACTDGIKLLWNPYWFLSIPEKGRLTVLVHELWHPAWLHMVRRGTRQPKRWNIAADYKINNMLDIEGYSFDEIGGYIDHRFTEEQSTEEVYHILEQEKKDLSKMKMWGVGEDDGSGDDTDIVEPGPQDSPNKAMTIASIVVQAVQVAIKSGEAGHLPGEIQKVLKDFLDPKIPWQSVVHKFMQDLTEQEYSMARPNRRYEDMYLPSLLPDEGICNLAFIEDVSGSVTDAEVRRFNSELKFVKEVYHPQKISLVQFDTKIQSVTEFGPDDPFDEVVIVGRGGTDLRCVRQWIVENKPDAVIVFSDLDCKPMVPVPGLNILWVCVNNAGKTVLQGDLIHIQE